MKIEKQEFQLLKLGTADYQLFRNGHPLICPFQPLQIQKSALHQQPNFIPATCTTNCPHLSTRDGVVKLSCGGTEITYPVYSEIKMNKPKIVK